MAHANLGRYRVYGNEPSAGLRYLSESLERVVPMRHKAGMAYVFDAIAEAAAQRGAHERSVHLFAAAHAIRDAIGAPPVPSLQERNGLNLRRLEERLGEEAFRTAWREGTQLSLEGAVAAAREIAESTSTRAAAR
jgi:hypothetical protein